MFISPFTPLFFIDRKADGVESDYIQTFAPSDRILLQIFGPRSFPSCVSVYSEPGHRRLFTASMTGWEINANLQIKFGVISLNPGYYSIGIRESNVPDGADHFKSEMFRVTDDPAILSRTTLIQYSMNNNRQRNDAMFFINGMQYFFDFRVHGGFKDSNWTFGVENEQFVTPYADISQLYGLESTQKRFTMGGGSGVPVWYGEMLNRILVCSHVYFDGVKYSRKESNVPEMTVQLDGLNSFVFNQTLQQSTNLDPLIEENNRILLRRIDNTYYRSTSENSNRII